MNLFIDQTISCHGNNDGSVQAVAFPPAPNYVYFIDGGTQINTSGFFAGLAPGTHTVCVSNGTSAPAVCKTITLSDPPAISISFVTDSLVSCHGNDGGFTANISGGTPPFSVSWTNSANLILSNSSSVTGIPPGVYIFHVLDDHGCVATASKFMNPATPLSVSASFSPIKCNGGTTAIVPSSSGGFPPVSFTIFGAPLQAVYSAGTYTILATDAKGCAATTVVTISQPNFLSSNMSATACDSYFWSMNGATYTATGYYVSVLTTLNGCTVVNLLDLTIGQSTTSTSNITACNSYHWSMNNVTYTQSGTYTATSINSSGCIQNNILNLIINQNTSASQTVSACNTYNWMAAGASNPYTTSGNYTATSINSAGCIRYDTLHLTINPTITTSQTVSACSSYNWTATGASNPYTASGNYTATSITASTGCLRVDTLRLTINQPTSSALVASACNTYTWNISGASNPYTASGTYTVTSTNAAGCVHTAILNLIIKSSTSSTSNVTANNGYVWLVNGATYTNTGTYTATLTNAAGCDSILTLHLTINHVPSNLNLRCFIEGFMQGPNQMKPVLQNAGQATTANACDTIRVELHAVTLPYATVAVVKTVMQQNGFSNCVFPSLYGNFYIAVKHRNAVQTWSANPVLITSSSSYDFTNAASKAFGANEREMYPGLWAFYSADLNQDSNVDLVDLGQLETGINNFDYGYLPEDINGDGNVDLVDVPFLETNISNFIYSQHP
jgi:hypothetical protein